MICTIGETVLDIIIKDFDNTKIRVGGSMLNTAITLGRLGLPVEHISYVSDDHVADSVFQFLTNNNISVTHIRRIATLKTNLALAFLDKQQNAQYSFYKNSDTQGLNFSFPKLKKEDVVLFGSYFSLNDMFREQLVSFLTDAKKIGAFVIYDPNFRTAHQKSLPRVKHFIEENIALSNLVKGSDEDFSHIFNVEVAQQAWNFVQKLGVQHLVYTKGAAGAEFINAEFSCSAKASTIKPLSTIGAGDTFTAGIIDGIYKDLNKLTDKTFVESLLVKSNYYSAQVCMSFDNYLSKEFIKTLNHV